MFKQIVTTVLLVLGLHGHAALLTKEAKVNDFNLLNIIIDSDYGPLHYKQENKTFDIQKIRLDYFEKISQTKTNEDFYYLMLQYVQEYHDGHFGLYLPTNYVAYLPIATELVDGKVLISSVKTDLLPKEKFAGEKGDEVIQVDGVNIKELLQTLKKYSGSGYELTELRKAAWMVFARPADRMPTPQGKVMFTIRKGTSEITEEYNLEWLFKGEEVVEQSLLSFNSELSRLNFNYDDFSVKNFDAQIPNPSADRKFACSGETRIEIPKDATIVMKTPIVAYYHPTAKGNVGYLRIPEYMAFNEKGESEFELRFEQYKYAVSVLEKNTVGMIIDQDHNCGGSVGFLESVLGLFMTEPYLPMQFELRANKQEYLKFKSYLNSTNPNTLQYSNIKETTELIKKHWLAGDYLTVKTPLTGNKILYPNVVHYTHPIVVLIDEISGSGGDAFPSLIQGYGRAKLLGTRTSGLGGHVNEYAPLPNSQLKMRMTKSLFYRPDGIAVENNGAVPDYPYAHTRNDFMFGYREYQKFYLEKLLALIK